MNDKTVKLTSILALLIILIGCESKVEEQTLRLNTEFCEFPIERIVNSTIMALNVNFDVLSEGLNKFSSEINSDLLLTSIRLRIEHIKPCLALANEREVDSKYKSELLKLYMILNVLNDQAIDLTSQDRALTKSDVENLRFILTKSNSQK